MKRRRSLAHAALLAVGVASLIPHAATAAPDAPPPGQQPAPATKPDAAPQPETYSPRTAAASHPMRVDVLTATTFREIESGQIYRLYGVDACDLAQTATIGKQTWSCGVSATAWLIAATLNKWIACTPIRKDGDHLVSRCASGEMSDIAAEMIKTGFAVTAPEAQDRAIHDYSRLEAEARKAYRGLWGSSFQMPWKFRAQTVARPANP